MSNGFDIIETLNQRIKDECSSVDMERRYRDMLDEIYSFDSVGGPFRGMSPARVLEEVDPIAYRVGLTDYESSEIGETVYDIDDDMYEIDACQRVLNDLISELESELDRVQEEVDSMNADDPALSGLVETRDDLERDIETLRDHSF